MNIFGVEVIWLKEQLTKKETIEEIDMVWYDPYIIEMVNNTKDKIKEI